MTKPILWTSTKTSGTIVHAMVAVSGLDIDVRFISLRQGEHKTPDFLAINPKGEVAALQMRDAAQRVQERLMAPLNAQERVDLMAILSKVVYNHQDPAGASGA